MHIMYNIYIFYNIHMLCVVEDYIRHPYLPTSFAFEKIYAWGVKNFFILFCPF